MPTYSSKKHIIELQSGRGSTWIVRVFRKRPLFNKLVSSDWFLDADQAERYVEELKLRLDDTETADLLATRRPGWVLRRPAH